MAAPKKVAKKAPIKKKTIKKPVQKAAPSTAFAFPTLSLQKFTRWQLITGVVVLGLALGFLLRGWLRVTVAPAVVTVTQGRSAKSAFYSEMDKLGQPLTVLGYENVEPLLTGCKLSTAQMLSTSFHCSYTFKAFKEVPTDQAGKDAIIQSAAELQITLQENGWSGEFIESEEYTSLTKLVKNINAGIDYTPDASYLKSVGDVTCLFGSNTAFATPDAPAIASFFTCSRNIDWLGAPTANEFLY